MEQERRLKLQVAVIESLANCAQRYMTVGELRASINGRLFEVFRNAQVLQALQDLASVGDVHSGQNALDHQVWFCPLTH